MAQFILRVGEEEYAFAPEMLTQFRLSKIKEWYGPEIGRYNNFIAAFFEGDPDAARCAVWVARVNAGEADAPEPRQMGDFSMAQWITAPPSAEDETEPNPTEAESPTTDSTETPTSSATDTSGSSSTSSSSPPETSATSGGSTS